MKKLAICFSVLLSMVLFPMQGKAQQSEDEKMIIKAIQQMFNGMRAGDSTMISAVFVRDARMGTAAKNREGKVALREGSLNRFLTQIATPHDQVYDEKIWSYEVRIDGPLAYVWTDYSFYLGEKLSHCGYNVFELVKFEEGWKITSIVDTRRKENCKTPELGYTEK